MGDLHVGGFHDRFLQLVLPVPLVQRVRTPEDTSSLPQYRVPPHGMRFDIPKRPKRGSTK